MKAPTLLAGAAFGLLFGGFQAANHFFDGAGLAASLGLGLGYALATGAAFGWALHAFIHSDFLLRQVRLDESELIAGERILHSALANLVVRPKDFGLSAFAFGELLWLAGMREQEAIGGALHLTTHRLVFRSHRWNRLRGTVGIFLATVAELHNTSAGLVRRLTLRTSAAQLDLILADVDAWIGRIRQAADGTPPAQDLRQLMQDASSSLGGLEPFRAVEQINRAINLASQGQGALELAGKPLLALSSIFLKEAFDRAVASPWQAAMQADTGATRPDTRV